VAFNRQSKTGSFGRDLTRKNGNIVSRILPVRIHELDNSDMKLLQDELGGPVRAVNFCYRTPGVNRPLRPEDSADGNLYKLLYRDQLNKLANTIGEIIFSLKSVGKTEKRIDDKGSPEGQFSEVKSIAVLPFVNMSNDPEQVFFSDGISEEIINTLVQIPDLKVAGRTSAFSFRDKNEDLRSIGEKLNVTNILEGSVRKSGNRVRVTAQLIEASTGFHLWSQKFDRDLNDIFIIQDEIARSIVESLQLTLSGHNVLQGERPHTHDIEAYQLYFKGMSYFYKRGLHMFDGLECFKEALKIDPDYALALVGLADSYTMLCLHSYIPPEEAWTKATKAAEQALRLEPNLAEAHNAAAVIAELFERNWTKAESEYIRALELKPSYLQARCWYGLFFLLYIKKEHEEAIGQVRMAVENDPMSSYARSVLSVTLSLSGLHQEAIEEGNKSIELDDESSSAWQLSGGSDQNAGNFAEAIRKYRHTINISGRHNWAVGALLNILSVPSEYQNLKEANYLYMELLSKSRNGYVAPSILAVTSAMIGKLKESISYFREAIDRHDPYIFGVLNNYPSISPFFDLPEIREMLENLGLYVPSENVTGIAYKI
jgi:TolB-like protein/Tfp pilus assembly protein PilF